MSAPLPPPAWLVCAGLIATPTLRAERIHVLDRGPEPTSASHFQDLAFLDWEGDGGLDVVGIDPVQARLLRVPVALDPPQVLGPAVTIRELPPIGQATIHVGNWDGVPGDDLALIVEAELSLWSAASRAIDPFADAERSVALPPVTAEYQGVRHFADFDGDGEADLLLAGPTWEQSQSAGPDDPGLLLFSAAGENPEVGALPTSGMEWIQVRPAPPWIPGGPPTIAIEGYLGEAEPKVIVSFGPDRDPVELDRFERSPNFPGNLAELDGVAPPERFELDLDVDSTTDPVTVDTVLRIDRRIGGEWQQTRRIPVGPGYQYSFRALVEDFDGDARNEVILVPPYAFDFSGISKQLPARYLDEPLEAAQPVLDSIGPLSPSVAVRSRPFGDPVLVTNEPSPRVFDLLGNPTSITGSGRRAHIRLDPRDPETEVPLILQDTPTSVAIGHLDGDAIPDLAVFSSGARLRTLAGPLPDAAPLPFVAPLPEETAGQVYLTDLERDGDDDRILASGTSITWRRSTVNSSGELDSSRGGTILSESTDTPVCPTRVLGHADFDGDGDTDLLVLNGSNGTIRWCLNSPGNSPWPFLLISSAGNVPAPEFFGGLGGVQATGPRWPDPENTRIFDADDDGDPDFLSIPSALGNRLTLHRNTSVGFSLEPLTPPLPELSSVSGYFGESSHADLSFGRFRGAAQEFALVVGQGWDELGNPQATMIFVGDGRSPVPAPTSSSLGATPFALSQVVDFDGDGFDDLIVAGTTGTDLFGNPTGSPDLVWYRSRGNGDFDTGVTLATPRGFCSQLLVADLDDDGLPDLISASEVTQTVEVFLHRELEPIPPFAEWIANFAVADSDPEADPDRDGASNLEEYANGSDPGVPHSARSAPEAGFTNYYHSRHIGWASHTRPRQLDGSALPVALEFSSNLGEWAPSTTAPTRSIDPAFPLWETLHWEVPYPDLPHEPRRFLRFHLRLPDP